jgi:hypothetical protein
MDMTVLQEAVEKLHETFDRTDFDIEARKISQKLEEAHYSPGDIHPIVDCMLSLLIAARGRGYSVAAVFDQLTRTAEGCLRKRWKKMPDGTYQAL